MSENSVEQPDWATRGKTIRRLIQELESFENKDLLVEISLDGGCTHKPISLVKKSGLVCLLVNSEFNAKDSNVAD
jgi:pentose-5-phosphate-3-epimerase